MDSSSTSNQFGGVPASQAGKNGDLAAWGDGGPQAPDQRDAAAGDLSHSGVDSDFPRQGDAGGDRDNSGQSGDGEAEDAEAKAERRQRSSELLDQGLAAIKDGDLAGAVTALTSAVQTYPSLATHWAYGRLMLRMAVTDRAVRHLRAATVRDPDNADIWIDLANAYYLQPDPSKAWKAEEQARRAEPGLVLGRDASGLRIRRPPAADTPKQP